MFVLRRDLGEIFADVLTGHLFYTYCFFIFNSCDMDVNAVEVVLQGQFEGILSAWFPMSARSEMLRFSEPRLATTIAMRFLYATAAWSKLPTGTERMIMSPS